MTDSKDMLKLRALLPHWMQHNTDHAEEFRKWAQKAGAVSAYLDDVAKHFDEANALLEKALDQLGGPVDDHEHGHEHHHHHHHDDHHDHHHHDTGSHHDH